jgi:hypothetical protein
MKALKIIGIILGGIVLLAGLVICIALLPSVQTWAARKAVAGQPGATIEIGRVSAGPGSTTISDLRVSQDGIVITAKNVSTRYSAWDFVFHKRVSVEDITAEGLVIDVRHAKPATVTVASGTTAQSAQPSTAPSSPSGPTTNPATHPQTPFNGILGSVQLPVDIHLAKVAVNGQVLLPAERTVVFAVHGSEITAAKEHGHIEWKVDFADANTASQVRAAHVTGTLGLHLTNDRRIDALEIVNESSVEGAGIPTDRIKFELHADQPAPGGDEHYTAALSLVRGAQTQPLLNARVDYHADLHQLAGTWDIAVRSEQAGAMLAGLGLPDLALSGAGKFTFQPDSTKGDASGEITAQATRLEKVSDALAPLGAIQVHALFNVGIADQIARLDGLELAIAKIAGEKLVDVATLQKISFNLTNQHLAFENPKSDLARIAVNHLSLAWAQGFVKPLVVEGGDFSLSLGVAADADGSHVRVRTIEPVMLGALTVRQDERKLVDQLTLSLRPTIDYSAEKISAELGDIALSTPAGDSVAGKFSAIVTNLKTVPTVAFAAHVQSKAVGALKPYLPVDIGPITVTKDVEGKLEGQTLQVAKASVNVTRGEGVALMSFEVLQPLTADFKTLAVSAPNVDAPAVRLRLGEVPLALAEAVVPKSKFAGALTGATFEVNVRSKDDLSLRTVEPLAVRAIGVTMDGQELVKGIDVLLDVSAGKHGDAITYDVRRLDVAQGTTPLVKLHVTGDAALGAKLAASAKGELEVDLGALARQPALASAGLARGDLKTTFDAKLAEAIMAKATVAIRNLTSKTGNASLGDIDVTLDASVKTDGSGSVNLPLTLTNSGRRSDLAVDGTFAKTKDSLTFAGKLGSQEIFVDDFQALAALAPSSPEAEKKPAAPTASKPAPTAAPKGPATTAAPVRDTAPFWKGVGGRFEVSLQKIHYGHDYLISGIHGAAVVDDSRIGLDDLEGKFKETPFKVNAGVTFDAKRDQPYALVAKANVSGFDVGEFLRASNPKEPPMMETNVSVDADVKGAGVNVEDLAQNAYGTFDVKGTKGVLRALAQKTGTAVGLGAKALGLFGAIKGSDSTVAVSELVSQLKELSFDSFSMHVERTADMNLKLTSLEFLSPSTRLTGTGTIEHRKGTAFDQLPLHVEAQLAGREHMEVLLRRVSMLNGTVDEKGYQVMSSPFVIGGTVGKPDSGELWKVLGKVGLGALFH